MYYYTWEGVLTLSCSCMMRWNWYIIISLTHLACYRLGMSDQWWFLQENTSDVLVVPDAAA